MHSLRMHWGAAALTSGSRQSEKAFVACKAAAPPRGSVISRASGPDMQPWQVARLQQAAAQGRRRVQVEKLCKEVQLPRAIVLEYLKTNQAPAEPDSAKGRAFDSGLVAEQGGEEGPGGWQQQGAAAAPAWQPRQPRQSQEGRQGVPAWKRYDRVKSLGRQAEATLEMVYSRTQWPSDDVIESMWDLHRLKKERVVEWFKARRLQDRQGQERRQENPDAGLEWFKSEDE